jgi:hypothetical protein
MLASSILRGKRYRVSGAAWILACLTACESWVREGPAAVEASTALGNLEGTVKWGAEVIPEPTQVRNTTDPEVCGGSHTLEDFLISPEGRGIANVFVALADVPAEKLPPLEPDQLILDNIECRFSPHASVLTVGSTIEALNSDSVLHTTHFYGALEVNLSLPIEGARARRTVSRPGMVIVKCDIHGWMQAFIRVDAHPFHAVSDSKIWHEKLGSQSHPVRIVGGETELVKLQY